MALEIIGIKNIVIVQNKIDLVTEQEALTNYNKIKDLPGQNTAKQAREFNKKFILVTSDNIDQLGQISMQMPMPGVGPGAAPPSE